MAIPMQPAEAAVDSTSPVVGSSSISTTAVDVTSAPATITVRVRLTDASGVQRPYFYASHGTTGQSASASSATLTSGTVQDGVWKATITIPQGSAEGRWTVRLGSVFDTYGNYTWGGDLRTITVTSTQT